MITFNKTPLRRNWMPKQPLLFAYWCLGIQFFDLPPYFDTVSYATYGYLPLTVQHLCDLQDAMPCHWLPGASHPPLLFREAEDFSEVTTILSMCLC